jgi:hypothetical protein
MGTSNEDARKVVPNQKVCPQRLKPHSDNAVTAALKRCATQKPARDRVFPEPAGVLSK